MQPSNLARFKGTGALDGAALAGNSNPFYHSLNLASSLLSASRAPHSPSSILIPDEVRRRADFRYLAASPRHHCCAHPLRRYPPPALPYPFPPHHHSLLLAPPSSSSS
eukprot:9489695-Pyramimonas_sp.AAC.1